MNELLVIVRCWWCRRSLTLRGGHGACRFCGAEN